MKTTTTFMAALLFFTAPCNHSLVCQPLVQAPAWRSGVDKEMEKKIRQLEEKKNESELDREIRQVMEKGYSLEERKRQVPAIAYAFARCTDVQRARRLAALCYLKTLGTPLMPIDIAEIALSETGAYGLSGKAVSPEGARGVWQLMPRRAKSHGYSPEEMNNDEKCADAAVRELTAKMAMARGNLVKAKKLYCGVGRAADSYEVKRRKFRKEIMLWMNTPQLMLADTGLSKTAPPAVKQARLLN